MDKNNKLPILITGASGSIGSYFDSSVIPLNIRLEDTEASFVKKIKLLNVNNYILIHLAALTTYSDINDDFDIAYKINVEGTRNLFSAAKKTGCKRFIFISTSHVYKIGEVGKKFDTNSPLEPRSIYGKTKLLAEKELTDLKKQFEGIELCIARVFSVLSNKMKDGFLLTSLHKRATQKDFSPIPGLDNIRDFLPAEEVCSQLLTLARLDTLPQIANICSGKGTAVREIVENVFKKYDISPDYIKKGETNDNDIKYIVGLPFFDFSKKNK